MDKSFQKHDGPFVRALDVALASFNVHRQAYYSGTFIGNHVHCTLKVTKLILMNTFTNENLQPENLNWLCTSITLLANRYDPRIRSRAAEISRKLRVAFELFAACHNIYDKLQVTDAEIHTLGKFFCRQYSFRTLILFRPEYSQVYGELPDNFCHFDNHPQDAYARGPCHPMALRMARWIRADGGAGSRIYP